MIDLMQLRMEWVVKYLQTLLFSFDFNWCKHERKTCNVLQSPYFYNFRNYYTYYSRKLVSPQIFNISYIRIQSCIHKKRSNFLILWLHIMYCSLWPDIEFTIKNKPQHSTKRTESTHTSMFSTWLRWDSYVV